ncbi:MFS transporter [Chloroflexota bacterium]
MMPISQERKGFLFGRLFYGWVIVLTAWLIMFLCVAVQIGSFPVFFDELLDYFGWSRGSLALGFTFNMLFMSAFGMLAGVILNRIGPRKTVITGAVIGGVSVALISQTSQPWHFYITYGFFLPLGTAMAFYVPLITTVRRWFSRRAALAVSLAMTGSAAGGAAGPFIAQALINSFGWQDAYKLLGLILAAGVIACAFMLKKDPESAGAYPDGSPLDETQPGKRVDLASRTETWSIKEAIRTRTLWFLIAAQAGLMIVTLSAGAHLKVWVDEDLKLGEGFALAMVSLMPLMAVVSRIPGGVISDRLMDRHGRKPILYLSAIGVAVFIFGALAVDSKFTAVIFAIGIGLSGGIGVGIFPTYLGDLFGVISLPVILGLVMLASSTVGALGPWLFGAIYDGTGSYDLAFVIGGILCVLSLICLVLLKPPTKKS